VHVLAELPLAGTSKVDTAGLRQQAAEAWRAHAGGSR
jgi:hypothetical protein